MAKKLPTPPKPRPVRVNTRADMPASVYDTPPKYASDNATSSGKKPKMNVVTGSYCK